MLPHNFNFALEQIFNDIRGEYSPKTRLPSSQPEVDFMCSVYRVCVCLLFSLLSLTQADCIAGNLKITLINWLI